MINRRCLLVINGGSSSVKFALFEIKSLTLLLSGKIEGFGRQNGEVEYSSSISNTATRIPVNAVDQKGCAEIIVGLIKESDGLVIDAVVHRIVLGLKYTQPQLITSEFLAYLETLQVYDPEHLPGEIILIKSFIKNFPSLNHVACFDTAFHATMPSVARQIAIPRRFKEKGVERYGFHGISYSYLISELKNTDNDTGGGAKVILAHLGSGASLAAVKNGRSVDTSMGFTPAAGLPMSTRSGDLDPGVAHYMMQTEKLKPDQFNKLINHESGLLGIAEVSSDVRELLKLQKSDQRAAEAVEFFCYQIKKWIGSYAAVLNGLDTLVFSGGIGEHIPEIRQRVCKDLQFLGIELDDKRNIGNEPVISTDKGAVVVRVIKTNEELMMARLARPVLSGLLNR